MAWNGDYFDNLHWTAVKDSGGASSSWSWDGLQWIYNGDSDGEASGLAVVGIWAAGYRPSSLKLSLTSNVGDSGTVVVKVYDTSDAVIGSLSVADFMAGLPTDIEIQLTFSGNDIGRIIFEPPIAWWGGSFNVEAIAFDESTSAVDCSHFDDTHWTAVKDGGIGSDLEFVGDSGSPYWEGFPFWRYHTDHYGAHSGLAVTGGWATGYRPSALTLKVTNPWDQGETVGIDVVDADGNTIGSESFDNFGDGNGAEVTHTVPLTFVGHDIQFVFLRVQEYVSYYIDITGICFSIAATACRPVKKPAPVSITPGDPGTPGSPAIPYRPGYCIKRDCNTFPVYRGFIPDDALTPDLNAGDNARILNESYVVGFYVYFEIPGMPAVVFRGSPGGSTVSSKTTCTKRICFPPRPYVPAVPAIPPTPNQYAVDYDLGWNHDIVIGTGNDIALEISDGLVSFGTAGVYIGLCQSSDLSKEGIGKYKVGILFDGPYVRIFEGANQVWGRARRASGDVFTVQRAGDQASVLVNGVAVAYVDSFAGANRTACAATIYKGGEGICIPESPFTVGLPVGTGQADAATPIFGLIGADYSYAMTDARLPALTAEGLAHGHGEADVSTPGMIAIAADRPTGWAMLQLPAPSLQAYSGNYTGISQLNAALPALSMVGGEGGYAQASVEIPALTLSAESGFATPQAQGGSTSVPALLGVALGTTGEVGTGNVSLPSLGLIAADAPYGQADVTLPGLQAFGLEMPEYDGILVGDFASLEAGEMYGFTPELNRLSGTLGPLEGEIQSGATLDQAMAGIEGDFAGELAQVARLDADIPGLDGQLRALAGAVAALDGRLTDSIDGKLYGGADLDGVVPGLDGELSGLAGRVIIIDGQFHALTGNLVAQAGSVARLDGDFEALEALWGRLDGSLMAMEGWLESETVTVAEHVAWVMNMTHQGLTRYPDFNFTHLVRKDGENYLVRPDGIYRIAGSRDEGQVIPAGFSLPSSDYGSSAQKRAPRLYLSGKVDRQFEVKVSADEGQEYASMTDIEQAPGYRRCKLPRGVRGTHLAFAVDSVDGEDFEIEGVDLMLTPLERKIQ